MKTNILRRISLPDNTLYLDDISDIKFNSTIWDGGISDKFSGGSGTEADPYIITTPDEFLFMLKSNSGAALFYKLNNDIFFNYSDEILPDAHFSYFSVGRVVSPLDNSSSNIFCGTLDGASHKISGFRSELISPEVSGVPIAELEERGIAVGSENFFRLAIFPNVGEGSVFKNLIIDRTLSPVFGKVKGNVTIQDCEFFLGNGQQEEYEGVLFAGVQSDESSPVSIITRYIADGGKLTLHQVKAPGASIALSLKPDSAAYLPAPSSLKISNISLDRPAVRYLEETTSFSLEGDYVKIHNSSLIESMPYGNGITILNETITEFLVDNFRDYNPDTVSRGVSHGILNPLLAKNSDNPDPGGNPVHLYFTNGASGILNINVNEFGYGTYGTVEGGIVFLNCLSSLSEVPGLETYFSNVNKLYKHCWWGPTPSGEDGILSIGPEPNQTTIFSSFESLVSAVLPKGFVLSSINALTGKSVIFDENLEQQVVVPSPKVSTTLSVESTSVWDGSLLSGATFAEVISLGDGSESNPFVIRTAKEFASVIQLCESVSAYTYFILDTDIDLNHIENNIFKPYRTDNAFNINFDGQGHTISNGRGITLFGNKLLTGGVIKNIIVKDFTTVGTYSPGQISGTCGCITCTNFGRIENCKVLSIDFSGLSGTNFDIGGGLVITNEGEMINCENYANIVPYYISTSSNGSSEMVMGGIAAFAGNNASFINCKNFGIVCGGAYSGGILGRNQLHWTAAADSDDVYNTTPKFYGCENYGEIGKFRHSSDSNAGYAAGIGYGGVFEKCKNFGKIGFPPYAFSGPQYSSGIAHFATIIRDCENHGSIKGSQAAAGIGGSYEYNSKRPESPIIIENCRNFGDVSGSLYSGGILGYLSMYNGWKIENCFNSGTINSSSGSSASGGIVGQISYYSPSKLGTGIGGISFSVNSGEIKGSNRAGGIAGTIYVSGSSSSYLTIDKSIIRNCITNSSKLVDALYMNTSSNSVSVSSLVGYISHSLCLGENGVLTGTLIPQSSGDLHFRNSGNFNSSGIVAYRTPANLTYSYIEDELLHFDSITRAITEGITAAEFFNKGDVNAPVHIRIRQRVRNGTVQFFLK